MKLSRTLCANSALLTFLFAAQVGAQSSTVEGDRVAANPSAPVDAAGGSVPALPTADAASPVREQTIYIPFNKLRDVFEKPGRGVFVPYEQFRALWERARSQLPKLLTTGLRSEF